MWKVLPKELIFCKRQELLVIEDLLSAMVGIEGKYVCVRRGRHKEGNSFYYQLEPSLDASLSVRFSGITSLWSLSFACILQLGTFEHFAESFRRERKIKNLHLRSTALILLVNFSGWKIEFNNVKL